MDSAKRAVSTLYRMLPMVLVMLMLDPDGVLRAGSVSTDASKPRQAGILNYDGESIFRGLFFAEGPVAELLPELWQDPTVGRSLDKLRTTPGVGVVQTRVIERLRRQPGRAGTAASSFFAGFAADLQSGDRVRIDEAMQDSSARVTEAVYAETGFELNDGGGDGSGAMCLFIPLVIIILLAALVAAVVLAVVFLWAWFWVPEKLFAGKSLQRDMWVDLLARRLEAPAQ